MTSHNNQAPRKLGPWGALGALAVLAVIVLGFIAGLIMLLKWA